MGTLGLRDFMSGASLGGRWTHGGQWAHWGTRGAHIRGFTAVGHGDMRTLGTQGHWGKGGAHIRGFSRRLPAEPTISPRVQNAWPRKSCRTRNIGCYQGDAHPREARGTELILHLHAWRGQGSWSPHHTWGQRGHVGMERDMGGLGWERDGVGDGDRDGMGGGQGGAGMG